ncbi:MAG: hypothetical protein V1934_08640 [Methanobacteriota archaeon]
MNDEQSQIPRNNTLRIVFAVIVLLIVIFSSFYYVVKNDSFINRNYDVWASVTITNESASQIELSFNSVNVHYASDHDTIVYTDISKLALQFYDRSFNVTYNDTFENFLNGTEGICYLDNDNSNTLSIGDMLTIDSNITSNTEGVVLVSRINPYSRFSMWSPPSPEPAMEFSTRTEANNEIMITIYDAFLRATPPDTKFNNFSYSNVIIRVMGNRLNASDSQQKILFEDALRDIPSGSARFRITDSNRTNYLDKGDVISLTPWDTTSSIYIIVPNRLFHVWGPELGSREEWVYNETRVFIENTEFIGGDGAKLAKCFSLENINVQVNGRYMFFDMGYYSGKLKDLMNNPEQELSFVDIDNSGTLSSGDFFSVSDNWSETLLTLTLISPYNYFFIMSPWSR